MAFLGFRQVKGVDQYMFRIAWKGLTGRKKDSFMLLTILLLSFFFSILTSTFQTNSERAKTLERRSIYGSWEYGAYGIDEGTDPFASFEGIEVTGTNRIIGRSSGFGTLASFDEGFFQQAELTLLEGGLPEGIDEVAIEQNQLSFFDEIPTIGSELVADTQVHLFDLEMENEPEETQAVMKEMASEEILKNLTDFQWSFFSELYGMPAKSPELQNQLRAELPPVIDVFRENRERSQGLEHYEDTILLQARENLLLGYYLNLPDLLTQEDSVLSEAEKTKGLKLLSQYLLDQDPGSVPSDPGGPETADELLIRGTGLVLPYKGSTIVRRKLTVTGIYRSISNAWLDGQGNAPTALVTEATAAKFIENGLLQSEVVAEKGYRVPVNRFVSLSAGTESSPPEINAGSPVIANTLAYPPGNSTDGILALAILVFIFFITLFGVFQLYMSQMNKRLRKLALLRAVGATTGQIRKLLLWELVILTGITLPLALVSGVGLAWLFSRGLQSDLTNFAFQVEGRVLALSILSGLIAVVLGVLYPLVRVNSIPLTGSISVKKPKAAQPARKILKGSTRPVTNLDEVLRLHRRFGRKQSFLTRLIYTIIFSALILSLLLSFLSFRDYRDGVVAVNMPDYEIRLDYALNRANLLQFDEELTKTGAVADRQHLIGRMKGQLTSESLWKDPLIDAAMATLPDVLHEELFISRADTEQYPSYFTEDARKVSVYGLDTDSMLFEILDKETDGLLNNDAFKTGEGVVMLYPGWIEEKEGSKADPDSLIGVPESELLRTIFKDQENVMLSFDFRDSDLMEKLSEEDTPNYMELTFNSEVNTENQKNILPPTTHAVEILDTITSFPEFGVWPFSASLDHPVILGSQTFVRQLLGKSRGFELQSSVPVSTLTPTIYGIQKTSIWAAGDKDADQFVHVQQVANQFGGKAINLHSDKEARFSAALRISAIVLVVAFIIALTALQIQMNISKARVEGERLFIGTLQSMGVSQKKLRMAYIRTGMAYSGMAVLFSHLIFLLVLAFQLVVSYPPELILTKPILLLKGQLWLYPWPDHLFITLVFFLIGTLIYYLPLRKVLKIDPIANIRGL